jgi:transcriptional regulator PpsR
MFAGFSTDDVVQLAYSAGDFMLAIDEQGIVCDLTVNVRDHGFARMWIGRKWIDTVTIESQSKIEQMLSGTGAGQTHWRQVNHRHDGDDVPVNYRVIRPTNGGWAIAVGRDLRSMAALQQRLLKAQQSMERDYLHLRQAETRYRLLFDTIAYPVLIVDAARFTIQQANRAAHALIDAASGALDGMALPDMVDAAHRNDLIAYFGAISANPAAPAISIGISGRSGLINIAATGFRQSGKAYWLVTMDDGNHAVPSRASDRHVLDVVERMPDAFVLTDDKNAIIVANHAFAELVHAGSIEQLLGLSLGRFIGRPDIDLNLLRKQLKDHEHVRNFGSIITDLNGGEEPVEISAIMIERDGPLYGYSVRSVARRERDLPPTDQDYPRSVEQLTELVGRKPLKEIVRESTDLIERMCIEAALIHTADNRASAAEILGVSRQSLYSKLHRHGLGNLNDRD